MTNKNSPEYSVVVPVYNSEGSLKELYERLKKVFNALNSPWELIFVNDYSRDNSWKVLRSIANGDEKATVINLTNNFGQQNALMCGLSYSKGIYAITIDDDLQHPPEEIPKLIKTITAYNYSVVYGQHPATKRGWFRDLASALIKKILSYVTGSGYTTTSFRIIKNSVVEKITGFKQYNVMIDVLIKDIVNKFDVGHCAIEHHERKTGKSGYSLKKLLTHAANMILNYTLWPLRLAMVMGFFFSFFSILAGIYFIVIYFLRGVAVQGWTSTMVIIAFFSGVNLFLLGIVGEYIGRVFLNIAQKPQYCVKEVYKKQTA